MKLYLKTLTPLHIGSDVTIELSDYVVYQNTYYRIPNQLAIKFAQENQLTIKFSQWISDIANKINDLEEKVRDKKQKDKKYNERLSKLRKEYNPYEFFKQYNLEKNFLKLLQEDASVLKIPLPSKQIPDTEIKEQIKNAKSEAYIPGSTIKGSIRTALLYAWLRKQNNHFKIAELLQESLEHSKKQKNIKSFGEQIEQEAFYCGIEDRNQIKYSEEKFDLMKLLLISDAVLVAPQNPFTLAKSNLFLTNSTMQTQSPWLEAIASNCVFEFHLDFNIHFLFALKPLIKNDAVTVQGKKEWIKIVSKCKQLFGIDPLELNENNLEEKKKQVLNNVLQAIQQFSNAQIEHDKKWKSKIRQHDDPKSKNQIFNPEKIDYSFLENKKVINLGFASGFTATTEFLYFLSIPELKDEIKNVMEFFEIGKRKTKDKKEEKPYEANPDAFPKSRTMIEMEDKILPLGWTEIIPENEFSLEALSSQQENVFVPISEPKKTEPTYYTGKIEKLKNQTVQGICISKDPKNPKNKLIKLFVGEPGKEPVLSVSYASDLPTDKLVEVRVTNVQKGKITSIQFVRFVE